MTAFCPPPSAPPSAFCLLVSAKGCPLATVALPSSACPRAAVLILGALETLLVAVFFTLLLWTSDPWAWAIGRAVAELVAIPYILLVVPALVMGVLGRWLPFALALALIAPPATILVLYHG